MPNGKVVYTGVLFHDLRRSAIMLMAQGGVDPTEAKKISGHETNFAFEPYDIITEAHVLAVGKKMDRFIAEQRQKLGSGTVITAEVVRPALASRNGDETETR